MKSAIPFIIIIAMGLLIGSCDRKSCENVVCPGIYSTCIDGNCYCESGYEGSNCDVETRDKYIGSYQVTENCTTSSGGFLNNRFTAYISSSYVDVLTIDNFTFYGGTVYANIIDATTLYIQDQRAGSIDISGGQGTYEGFNRITFEHRYTVSGNFHSCTAIYTKF